MTSEKPSVRQNVFLTNCLDNLDDLLTASLPVLQVRWKYEIDAYNAYHPTDEEGDKWLEAISKMEKEITSRLARSVPDMLAKLEWLQYHEKEYGSDFYGVSNTIDTIRAFLAGLISYDPEAHAEINKICAETGEASS